MAKKIKTTRPELKRYRDALRRYERYLPMLKLKEQQLRQTQREIARQLRAQEETVQWIDAQIREYEAVLTDVAGVSVARLSEPEEVRISKRNIAGVEIPVFDEARFPAASYSLFGTPSWVDRTLEDHRRLREEQAKFDVLHEDYRLISHELTRIIQRVNLFEKVKIPEAQEAIRVIRIKLGDRMTAAVGRAKIAKYKIAEAALSDIGDSTAEEEGDVTTQEGRSP
ncbi:MAG: V-type ATP synthase subunit D [Planctomycetota bacterium]|jgi:V/A-type H+-transporting ATPase subunit D